MPAQRIPILPSSDFDATAAFFGSIGFAETARYPGEYLILVHPAGIELHFWLSTGLVAARNDAGCYVRFPAAQEAQQLCDAWAAAGLDSDHLRPPVVTDYGLLEFALLDPDGNLLRIGGVVAG